MKTSFITAACSTFAALSSAAPTDSSTFEVAITFWGADGSSFFQSFPADDTTHAISMYLTLLLLLTATKDLLLTPFFNSQPTVNYQDFLCRRRILLLPGS